MKTASQTNALQILQQFNQITGRNFREIKANLNGISARLQEGYKEEEMLQIIQVKTIEWKNTPEMAVHLNPVTIFRPANFQKYINQLEAIKENPKLYAKYFAKINGRTFTGSSAADNADAIDDLYG